MTNFLQPPESEWKMKIRSCLSESVDDLSTKQASFGKESEKHSSNPNSISIHTLGVHPIEAEENDEFDEYDDQHHPQSEQVRAELQKIEEAFARSGMFALKKKSIPFEEFEGAGINPFVSEQDVELQREEKAKTSHLPKSSKKHAIEYGVCESKNDYSYSFEEQFTMKRDSNRFPTQHLSANQKKKPVLSEYIMQALQSRGPNTKEGRKKKLWQ